MPVQPEPILDIVRGLSTVASFAIVVNQLRALYDDFFTAACERCRGTGCLTCPHCHGSKTIRKRPGFVRVRDLAVIDNPEDSYSCFYCGPTTAFDFNPMAPDDEGQAMKIQENLKAAYGGTSTRPFVFEPLAGTVPCTACGGNPKVHRLTPDFGKVFGLDGTWDFDISRRMGGMLRRHGSDKSQNASRPLFLEYPSSAPMPVEIPTPQPDPKKAKDGDEEDAGDKGFVVRKNESYNLDDYVLNFASDDEERR